MSTGIQRILGGQEVTHRSFRDAMASAGIDELPCFCSQPAVIIKKRGTEADSIFWCECEMCKRQYQPAWTRNGAVHYVREAIRNEKDPYKLGLPRPDKTLPKVGYIREIVKQKRKRKSTQQRLKK